MRSHPKPDDPYEFTFSEEKEKILAHIKHRQVPDRTDENLIIATWNMTNFGQQKRKTNHIKLMAEIIKPFDIIAVQEIADNLNDMNTLLSHLPDYTIKYTDIGGNKERLGYIYRKDRATHTELAAELAMRGYERRKITITVGDKDGGEYEEVFDGFNRNPYMLGFINKNFDFTLVNVHLYQSNLAFRQLEAIALAKWAKNRVTKKHPPCDDIILIGDFNMYKPEPSDKTYKKIIDNSGAYFPAYETELVGTNLAGDGHYDQLAFFPSRTQEDFTNRIGVLDFDKVIFNQYWPTGQETPQQQKQMKERFYQNVRYYIADHRPFFAEFKTK